VISELERRLAEFVDREGEMNLFCRTLDSGERPVFVIEGEGGVGKSSLLARMGHECALRSLRKSEIVWTDTRRHDYLAIMRKVRDDIGVAYFEEFTDLVNFFTVPRYELSLRVETAGTINVAQHAHIEGSSIGSIAGVLIKDAMIVVPRADMAVPEAERMARLTDRFLASLAAAALDGPTVVLFFDAVEKMTVDTRAWIWVELLGALRAGRLTNVRVVLCGREHQAIDRELALFVEHAELRPLALENVIEYLARRGVRESDRVAVATALLVATAGNPLQLATCVDGYLRMRQRADHG
jgi:hypothetical protein